MHSCVTLPSKYLQVKIFKNNDVLDNYKQTYVSRHGAHQGSLYKNKFIKLKFHLYHSFT